METQQYNDGLRNYITSQDIRNYFILIKHWTWLIVLGAIMAAGAAYFVSSRITPVYQAESTFMVNEAPGSRSTDYSDVILSERLTRTYAAMIIKKPVLDDVIEHLDLKMSSQILKNKISVEPIQNTQLITIKVEDTDPVRAAAIANELGLAFSKQIKATQEERYASTKKSLKSQLDSIQEQINEVNTKIVTLSEVPDKQLEQNQLEATLDQYHYLYNSTLQSYEKVRLAEAETTSNVFQVEESIPPKEPIRPKIIQNISLAGLIGIMVTIGIIFILEVLDDTIRSLNDAAQFELPILGVIQNIDETEIPITITQPRSPVSEAFRSLRTSIQYAGVDFPLRKILITSSMEGEGKTTVTVNLGVVLAQGRKNVKLVDVDLRRPRLHRKMQISNQRGLSSLFMRREIHLDEVLQNTKVQNLSVITSGNLPPNPSELVGSERMYQILSKIESRSDIVLLDSPPATVVTDAVILSKHVDGVLLIFKIGETKMVAAQQTIEQLKRVGANIIGIVLNNQDGKSSPYSYYSSDYYSEEHV